MSYRILVVGEVPTWGAMEPSHDFQLVFCADAEQAVAQMQGFPFDLCILSDALPAETQRKLKRLLAVFMEDTPIMTAVADRELSGETIARAISKFRQQRYSRYHIVDDVYAPACFNIQIV